MYAVALDMIAKWGETEIARLSSAYDAPIRVDVARCDLAIGDAQAIVDSYLRGRYAVPLIDPPREIVTATLVLARHELAQGDGREPTTQMIEARRETIRWLERVAAGTVSIAGASVYAPGADTIPDAGGADSGARFEDRRPSIDGGGRGFI